MCAAGAHIAGQHMNARKNIDDKNAESLDIIIHVLTQLCYPRNKNTRFVMVNDDAAAVTRTFYYCKRCACVTAVYTDGRTGCCIQNAGIISKNNKIIPTRIVGIMRYKNEKKKKRITAKISSANINWLHFLFFFFFGILCSLLCR